MTSTNLLKYNPLPLSLSHRIRHVPAVEMVMILSADAYVTTFHNTVCEKLTTLHYYPDLRCFMPASYIA